MHKEDITWLNVGYIAAALVFFYLAKSAITVAGLHTGWSDRYDEWFPLVTTIASIVIGGGVALALRGKPERHEYFLNSIAELRKVTWPSWEDTKRMTVIVVVVVLFFAGVLAIFDFTWAKILKLIIA